MSQELKTYPITRGVATSRTTPYHPTENSQYKRYNQTIWKTVRLQVPSKNLKEEFWHEMLLDALHSIHCLLCASTNATSHERFFCHQRRSMLGQSSPLWLTSPAPVLLRKFARSGKSEPLCDQVELIQVNPNFACIRFFDGRENTVSLTDLAPCPPTNNQNAENDIIDDAFSQAKTDANLPETPEQTSSQPIVESECPKESTSTTQLRRFTRVRPIDMMHELIGLALYYFLVMPSTRSAVIDTMSM